MSFLNIVGESVANAWKTVVEKNRKLSLINRVRLVIETEEEAADRDYIALGKYYYRYLRDENNKNTELYCLSLDNSNRRLTRAKQRLAELLSEESEPEEKPSSPEGETTSEESTETPLEEQWEPMSELDPEEDVLDGNAAEALAEDMEESPQEVADATDGDQKIPWA